MRNLLRHSTDPSVSAALGDFRRTFWSVAAFSAVVNILMFASPLYMMQVYDRVLSGRSIPTLVGLTIILVGLLTFQAIIDLIRSRIVVRAAGLLDQRLAGPVHRAIMQLAGSLKAALGVFSRTRAPSRLPTPAIQSTAESGPRDASVADAASWTT